MKKKVHVVPHSHWDREWYFTTSRSKIYLMNNLQKVLDLLEKENGYNHFVLDGQASLLDDYLAWKPQDKDRIKKLVEAGKLIVGPWYTQTDQLVISAESIVRNMQYGMMISEEFGGYMNVGYVPDSFGQSAAMPQIYKAFEIEDTLFWRGVSDDEVEYTEYQWVGEDGTSVNVYQIPAGYYIGGEIPEDDILSTFLNEDPFKTVWSRSTTDNVLFPNGFDQAPPRENLVELVDRMNQEYEDYDLEISTFENYINSIKEQHPELKEISGELLNGKMMRIHKSIFSSRPDLKALNTKVQNYLVNTLEPILSIAYSFGLDYPTEVVKEIWKLMFENAAHDSIGSCVSDMTNEDIYLRYKKAYDLAENLTELKIREMVMRIKTNEDITITAFNTTSESNSGLFETTLYVPQLEFSIEDEDGVTLEYTILNSEDQTDYILGQGNVLNPTKEQFRPTKVFKVDVAVNLQNVPAFGFKQFAIKLSGSTHKGIKELADSIIENEYYRIEVNENNALDILDKELDYWYRDQAIIEENGDDGDSFNYSPPSNDLVIKSTDFIPEIKVLESDLISEIRMTYKMVVSKNLKEREQGVAQTELPISLNLKLKKNSPFIDFKFSVDNRNIDSHRMCVNFNSDIVSKFSYADHQFGVIKRPVVRETEMRLYEENKENWNEMPISIETCQTFAALENDERGVAVIPKGVREYEIIGDNFDTIRLTLFRTYGYMGKTDLVYRPGRASGETVIATPDAQLHKELSFEFSVIYYQGNLTEYGLSKKVINYLKDIEIYQYAEYLNTRLRFTQYDVEETLQKEFSLLETNSNLVLSLVKKAEQREGFILRFYNGNYHVSEELQVKFNRKLKLAEWVNLKEDTKEKISFENNEVHLNGVEHGKFITLYVEFD